MSVIAARLIAEIGADISGLRAATSSISRLLNDAEREVIKLQRQFEQSFNAIERAEERANIKAKEVETSQVKLTAAKQKLINALVRQEAAEKAVAASSGNNEAVNKKLTAAINQVALATGRLAVEEEKSNAAKGEARRAATALDELQQKQKSTVTNLSIAQEALTKTTTEFTAAIIAQNKVLNEQALARYEEQAKRVALQSLGSAGRGMSQIGRNATMNVSLPLAIAGYESVKAATDYEFAIAKINGLTNVSIEETKRWSQAILELAPEVGKTPKELAEAMFYVASSSFRGAEALDILEKSAKASEAGLGTVAEVSRAASYMIYNYGQQNLSAAHAMDVLVGIVREGNVQIDSVAGSIGRVLPLTANMGVSIENVGAAIAIMTRSGFTADRAITSLQTALATLQKGGPATEKALTRIHLSTKAVVEMMQKDLFGTLVELDKRLKAQGESLVNVFPNMQRGSAGMIAIVGKSIAQNAEVFSHMNNLLGAAQHSWEAIGNTSKLALDKMKSSVEAAAISLGKALAPAVVRIADAIAAASKWFSELSPQVKEFIGIVGLVAIAFGPAIYVIGQFLTAIYTLITLKAAVAAFMASTAAGETAVAVAGAAIYAELLPLIGIFALLSGAVYGLIKLQDNWTNGVANARKQLEDQRRATLTTVSVQAQLAGKIKELVDQYAALNTIGPKTKEQQEKLREVLGKINDISPTLVRGLGEQTNQLYLVANAAKIAAENYGKYNDAVRKASVDLLKSEQSNLTAQLTSLKDQARVLNLRDWTKTDHGSISYGLHGKDQDTFNQLFKTYTNYQAKTDEDLKRMQAQGILDLADKINKTEEQIADVTKQLGEITNPSVKPAQDNGTPKGWKVHDFSGVNVPDKSGDLKTAQEVAKEWKKEMIDVAKEFHLHLSSGFRPGAIARGSGRPSLHSMSVGNVHGLAEDFSGTADQMAAFFNYIKEKYVGKIKELIYSPLGQVFNGKYNPEVTNAKTRADHYSHVHVALKEGIGNTDDLYSGKLDAMNAAFKAQKDAVKEAQEAIRSYHEELAKLQDPYTADMAKWAGLSMSKIHNLQDGSPEMKKSAADLKALFDQYTRGEEIKKIAKQIEEDSKTIIGGITDVAKYKESLQGTLDLVQHPRGDSQYEKTDTWINEFIISNRRFMEIYPQIAEMFDSLRDKARDTDWAIWARKSADEFMKWVEKLKESNRAATLESKNQLFEVTNQANIMAEADPYKKWLLSQTKLNNAGFPTLPAWMGKIDPRTVFDNERQNKGTESQQKLLQDTIKTAQEMRTIDPFKVWLISFMEFDQVTKTWKLPIGMDEKTLKGVFNFQQNLALYKQFAEGVKGIFSGMLYDIKEKGFKGLFSSVYHQFNELLFKMAVEYLSSQFYQLIMNSFGGKSGGGLLGTIIGGILGSTGGGGSAGANAPNAGYTPPVHALGGLVGAGLPIIIGENGPELFVPGASGYVVPNHAVNYALGAQGFAPRNGPTARGYGSLPESETSQTNDVGGHHYNFTFNVQTPNAQSFRQAQGQLIAEAHRTVEVKARRYGK